MNIILLCSELIISIASIIYLYTNYKKEGLYIWTIIAVIIGNIMITKTISISNIDVNTGALIISSIFISTNILIQKEGIEAANKNILLVLTTSVLSLIVYNIISLNSPSNITYLMDKSFNNQMINNLLIYIFHTITLVISLKVNNIVYYKIKLLDNKIWISNIISMIIAQMTFSIIFGILYSVYYHYYFELIIMIIIRFILSIIAQIFGTIIIYYIKAKN